MLKRNLLRRRLRDKGDRTSGQLDVPVGSTSVVLSIPRSDLVDRGKNDVCFIQIQFSIDGATWPYHFGCTTQGGDKKNWRGKLIAKTKVQRSFKDMGIPSPTLPGLKYRYRLKLNYKTFCQLDVEFL